MLDQVVTIPTESGEPVRLLFTHAAFYRLEREHGLTILAALRALDALSVMAIEAALLCGLEGHRERFGGRATAWTQKDVRELLAGPLSTREYADLIKAAADAITAGARRGKAPTPTEPPAAAT